jgi:enoyl-CoA hydratase/carnithine racemase
VSGVAAGLGYETRNAIATIWLDRPGRHNAINRDMLRGIRTLVARAEADDAVRVLLVRGANGTFCSGFDLSVTDGEVLGRSRVSLELVTDVTETLDVLAGMRKPTVAVAEGWATAAGFELLISCDFAIAAQDARIGDLHIRRGVTAGGAPSYRLPRIIGIRRAKELLMTGAVLSGTEAAAWGLINRTCPADELDEVVGRFVAPMVESSTYTMWLMKMAADRGLDGDTGTLMVVENLANALSMQSEDAQEGARAFLEKRPASWSDR